MDAGFPQETRPDAETLLAHVEDLTRRDVKATYLKQLQGGFGSVFVHRLFPFSDCLFRHLPVLFHLQPVVACQLGRSPDDHQHVKSRARSPHFALFPTQYPLFGRLVWAGKCNRKGGFPRYSPPLITAPYADAVRCLSLASSTPIAIYAYMLTQSCPRY